MFKKILIANRGEIACRVIRTARKMGIRTVAVYSEADALALHVESADEAVAIGPAPSKDSYLSIERLVEACRKTGAEAVHPGYGFLSEREAFPKALKDAGVEWIGPNPHAIRAMGDKIESKKLAAAARVTTVPGFIGEIKDVKHAAKIAAEIGYPVMVKASAGGGGKGLRICFSEAELAQAIQSAMNEARSSFGDDRIFIEKYVTEPRHIEIQVLGDRHGNLVHLGERECSIQRRHQKVIEEAPSPFVTAEMRAAMGAQAVGLARAVGYDSAGTVEFIVDKDRHFYFLEMNTRLQVEHPVTELVTGVDLVEQMIRVAAGEKLAFAQKDVTWKGWAIESRINAEDPYRNFLPSTGRLIRFRPPAAESGRKAAVRVDTGVYEGGEIPLFYDSMIAKLIAHADDRNAACDAMADALDAFAIEGIQNNVPFLSAVMNHARFRAGRLTTGFIAEEFPEGFHGAALAEETREKIAAVMAFAAVRETLRKRKISGQINGIAARPYSPDWAIAVGERVYRVSVALEGPDEIAVAFADARPEKTLLVESAWTPGQPVMRASFGGRAAETFQFRRRLTGWTILHRGASFACAAHSPEVARLAALMPKKAPPDTSKFLLCPMPGLVVSVNVSEGQEVKAGEALAVVEAMKMENVLRAERDGTVKRVAARKGDSLAVDAVILEFA